MVTAKPSFLDFDLHIGQARAAGYPVAVQMSPAGETSEPVDVALALDDPRLDLWLADGGSTDLTQTELIAWGKQLASYLLPEGEVRYLYQQSRGIAIAEEARLRLRLRIAPPELAAMPWEYAYDSAAQEFIALSNQTALVRYPSQPVPPRTVTSALPLPILVLAANLAQQPSLGSANEVLALAEALAPLSSAGGVTVDVLFSGHETSRNKIQAEFAARPGVRLLEGPASLDSLRNALRRGYRVIHFIGHAKFDRSLGGVLFLAEADGTAKLVSAEALARELRDTTAAAVVLNACQSAVEGTERSFVGLAPRLIQAGVPAVVAMQHVVADVDAQVFSQALYQAIADGWPLDAAVTEGRRAISARQVDSAAWGIPVLFMRSKNGILWVEPARVQSEEIQSSLQSLASQAAAAALAADQTRAAERRRLAEGVTRFAERLRTLAGAAKDVRHASPYRGLLEYRLSDAGIFCGRDQAVADVLEHLERSPLLILHAESGAGKTSLIHAGLEPRLLTGDFLPIYLRPYDEDPGAVLQRTFLLYPDDAPGLASASLRTLLEELCAVLGPEKRLIIFLDQFEEFFTQVDGPTRQAFIDNLAECLETVALPVHWVLALRSEYLSSVAAFHPRIRNPIENHYRLNRLTRLEAGEAIVIPARRFGVSYEPELVERLLDDLGKDDLPTPQTQLVCYELFESLAEGENVITGELYDRLGGAAGILREHLERVLQRGQLAGREEVAQSLLKALLNSEGQRVLRTEPDLAAELATQGVSPDIVHDILPQLVDSRLLRTERPNRPDAAVAYELAHDYLASQLWLSPEERTRKAAQELLEQEVQTWRQHGVPMRAKSLEVIGAVRAGLAIDEAAATLLVRSALETDIDLAGWLAFVPRELARSTLLDGMEQTEPAVRARAARHLAAYCDAAAVTRLAGLAANDPVAAVRSAALQALETVAPSEARQVLLAELHNPDPERRSQAARQLQAHLDQEVAGQLFAAAIGDADETTWRAALQTLASDPAAPFQAGWRPLLAARRARKAAAYRALRGWRAPTPFGFAVRTAPARVVDAVQREARTHPGRLVVGAAAAMALLYLVVAWVFLLPPFWSNAGWRPVAGSPETPVMSLAAAGERLYVGSRDWGVARRDADGTWRYWLDEGLPTVEEGKGNERQLYVKAINSIAADPRQPDRVYTLIEGFGVFRSFDAGETWQQIGAAAIPTIGVNSDLAVWNEQLLLADAQAGVFGSADMGQTWRQFGAGDGLPTRGFEVVGFAKDGTPYVGGEQGLYRGVGPYSWRWEAVAGVPRVLAMDIGVDGRIYIATGQERARTALCREPDGRILVARTFNNQIIISVAALPDKPGAMMIGTLRGAMQLECAQPGSLNLLDLISSAGRYVSKMTSFQDVDGATGLLQATQDGLLEYKP